MKIILMTDVPSLGHRGELKEVASGYARNFLLPKKLAVPATPGNLQNLEHLKRQRVREEAKARQEADAMAARVAGLDFRVTARASEDGRLYGSVTAQDVAEFLDRNGVTVEKRRVLLAEPIKALGQYQVGVRLHAEVTAELPVTVARE
jgi:large subunit ribosomal protein L9